jgi:hypothetical protein
MAAAKQANELKALRERVAELEKQLGELRAIVGAGQPLRQYWPDRPHTEEEEIAFHEASQRVQEIIRRNREADRRRAAAEYDRLHGRVKKKSSTKRKATHQAAKTRRAG